MNAVQINRNEACTEHVDWNVGDSYTIVFGNYRGGILEIKGEKPHGRKRLWRRYDASKPHRVTAIKSGIRVSLTAFRKANVSKEFRDQFLLDEDCEEEQGQTVNTTHPCP